MSRRRNPHRRADWWHIGTLRVDTPAAAAEPEQPPPPATTPTLTELRHGYTLDDLQQMTRAAVAADRSMAANVHDRFETAWSAIAEALYAADAPPPRHRLVEAGWSAIYREVRATYRESGYNAGEAASGWGTAPRWAAYWLASFTTPSHEDRIVEKAALPALLQALTPSQRDVITALAVHHDRQATADALGLTRRAVDHQLRTARHRAAQLWHEGETPRRSLQRPDRRQHHNPVQPHGTLAAARRHKTRGERPCPECAEAQTVHERDRSRRRRAHT